MGKYKSTMPAPTRSQAGERSRQPPRGICPARTETKAETCCGWAAQRKALRTDFFKIRTFRGRLRKMRPPLLIFLTLIDPVLW